MSNENSCKVVNGPDLELFDSWVRKNYGGNSRTKTITREKYTKICSLLRGEQTNSNAKFRFWVRTKGFRLLRHNHVTDEIVDDLSGQLYVSLHAKEETTPMIEGSIENFLRTILPAISFFRKVATVDEFYDVIKIAHIDEKGKHAGQKKTYRLVSDTYAFLPREVITFYLLNCDTCKPRIQKYGPIQAKNRQKNELNKVTRSPPIVPPSIQIMGEKLPNRSSESCSSLSVDSIPCPSSLRSSPMSRPPSLTPSTSNESSSTHSYKVFNETRESPKALDEEYIDPVGDYEPPKPRIAFHSDHDSRSSMVAIDNSRQPMYKSQKSYEEEIYQTRHLGSKYYGKRFEPYGMSTRERIYTTSRKEPIDLPLHIDVRSEFASAHIQKHFLHAGMKPTKEQLHYNMYAKNKPPSDLCISSRSSYLNQMYSKLESRTDRYLSSKHHDIMLYEQKMYGGYPPVIDREIPRGHYVREEIRHYSNKQEQQRKLYEEQKMRTYHDIMYPNDVLNYKETRYERALTMRMPVLPHY